MKEVTIEHIARAEKAVTATDLQPGRLAYREFLTFFSPSTPIDRHRFIIGAHFTYAWMPCMLEQLDEQGLDAAVESLDAVRVGCLLTTRQLTKIQSVVHSMVAASKLLHFVSPALYPILDGRVADFLKHPVGRKLPTNDVATYEAYAIRCRELVSDRRFKTVHQSMQLKLAYKDFQVSPLRAVELVMWVSGRKLL